METWVERADKRGRRVKVWQSLTDPRRFQAEFTIHHRHYHDGVSWKDVDERFTDDGPNGKKCDTTAHILRVGNGGTRTWYPRREIPTEYLAITAIEYWRTTGGGSWRPLTLPTPAWSAQKAEWDLANLKATLTNTWRQSKAEFILKDSTAPTRLRFAYTLVGLTWDGWALRSIADNTVVGWVTPPVAWDATLTPPLGAPNVTVTATNSGGYIEYSVDTAGKTFPIKVDPTFTDGYGGDVTTYKDAYNRDDDPTTHYENFDWYGHNLIMVRNQGGLRYNGFVQFDVSSIANDVTVDAGTFSISTVGGGIESVFSWGTAYIRRVTQAWTEAGITWNTYDGANNWSTAGGDFAATDYGSHAFPNNTSGWHDFDVTTLVGQWVAGTYTNNGMVVDPGADLYMGFCSSDDSTTADRLKLVVVYTEAGGGASSGLLTLQPQKVLAGPLPLTATLLRATSRGLAGVLASAATVVKQATRSLAGALASAATLAGEIVVSAETFYQDVAGALATTGTLVKQTGKGLAGTLISAAALARLTARSLTGALATSAVLSGAKVAMKSLAGALATSATLAKRTGKGLAGTLASSGAVTRTVAFTKALAGTLGTTGALFKRIPYHLAGTLASAGVLTTIKAALVSLAGSLTVTATVSRATSHGLAGALTAAGTITRQVRRTLAGALAATGALSVTRTIAKALAGTLALTGELTRSSGKLLTGSLIMAGSIGKAIGKALSGILSAAASLLSALVAPYIGIRPLHLYPRTPELTLEDRPVSWLAGAHWVVGFGKVGTAVVTTGPGAVALCDLTLYERTVELTLEAEGA